jgi:hypothetical protein
VSRGNSEGKHIVEEVIQKGSTLWSMETPERFHIYIWSDFEVVYSLSNFGLFFSRIFWICNNLLILRTRNIVLKFLLFMALLNQLFFLF